MKYHIISAEYISGYCLRITFRDGTSGEIDLSKDLNGPMFEPLRAVTDAHSLHPSLERNTSCN